jgi:hypothetical protein
MHASVLPFSSPTRDRRAEAPVPPPGLRFFLPSCRRASDLGCALRGFLTHLEPTVARNVSTE